MSPGRAFLLVTLLVLALRLPFLDQAIQGDDSYYLTGAMHAQIDPWHPTHGKYVFAGKTVDMRGHPHPPLNMWVLAGLLALFGDVKEVPFHAAYVLFSLIAAWAMLSLARRFSPRPVWAVLLFLVVPPFVVNGNSLESDIPFLAFWMASAALFVAAVDRGSVRLLAAAVAAWIPAALAAYQSVVFLPIGALYLWLHRRRWIPAWAALATPPAVLAAWQLFERLTGGALPASVLAGYFESYGFQALGTKLQNAAALTVHLGWIVFPPLALAAYRRSSKWLWAAAAGAALAGAVALDPHPLFWFTFGTGVLVALACAAALRDRRNTDEFFLSAWVILFFAAALALFFAGSARYLLPLAAPLCLLVSRRLASRPGRLATGAAFQAALALGLAWMNYQHWDAYRRFVAGLRDEFAQRRVWVNAEWGLRFYAEAEGGLPLEQGKPVRPGDMILTSAISYPIEFTTGGGVATPVAAAEVRPTLPLRIIGLGARSAYSTVTLGYRPFDVVFEPLDRVRAEIVLERRPALSDLPMNAPEAASQIVSGVYQLEENAWRWTAARAVFLLKAPSAPALLEASIYVPDAAPARRVTLSAGHQTVAEMDLPGPGSYTVRSSEPFRPSSDPVTVVLTVDRTFSPRGDDRELGVILVRVGFRQP